MEQEVVELKKDPLHTQVTALVDDHLDARLGATRDEFMNLLSASLTTRITKQVKNQLPQILPEEVSNFAAPSPPEIQCMVNESLEQAVLAKESYKPQSSYEAAAMLIEFELKKILIDKMDKSESYLGALNTENARRIDQNRLKQEEGLAWMAEPETKGPKATKNHSLAQSKGTGLTKIFWKSVQAEEPEFEVVDSDMPRDQDENLGKDDEEPKGKENPEGGDYLFDLIKPLPLVMSGNHHKVPVDYFFNNDLKYLQRGVPTMTYMTSITKAKAAQYDLPGIEDMVPNIWVPIKVAYDKHALWGILHIGEKQRKDLYGYDGA
ncbi:hypothetical protein Tco_0370319 [Tanacetum coccineum]